MDANNQIVHESAYEQGYADGFSYGKGLKVMIEKLREMNKQIKELEELYMRGNAQVDQDVCNKIFQLSMICHCAIHEYDDDLK